MDETTMDEMPRRERITDEATRWWIRLGTKSPGEIPRAEREEFTRWLRESPVNIAEWLHVAHVHNALERFKLWRDVDTDTATPESDNVVSLSGEATSPEASPRRLNVRPWAVAASLLLLILAGAWFLVGSGDQTLRTDRAERREVVLADGSVVELDPETRLQVRLQPHERHVLLEQGRALFRVAKDPKRPFWVQADQTVVRAVGTEFAVEQRRQQVVVTVAEGKVTVSSAGESGGSAAPVSFTEPEASPRWTLIAGEQVTVPAAGSAAPVRAVDPVRALAWTQGRLVFENETLGEIIAQFNRYNHVQLSISDPQLASRRVSGVFEATDPETLLAFIQAGSHVRITHEGAQRILIAPSP